MRHFVYFVFIILSIVGCADTKQVGIIPIIYCTDLYQPPQDPDDHYDLAILASLHEFDVRAVVFDNATNGRDAAKEAGVGALKQISEISKKPVPPYAIGLSAKLTSEQDLAENQPIESQEGVKLIISTLRKSKEKITLFLVGSCRDFAVAYNREPELFHEKVKVIYVNAGNGPDGNQFEWNVSLDPYAYIILMKSGLPINWAPCFSQVNLRQATPEEVASGDKCTYNTYYIIPNQARLLELASDKLKNYFAYALNREHGDPVSFLSEPVHALPERGRNMWCTAVFIHATGRKIYFHNGQYRAYPHRKANEEGISDKEISVFRFEPVAITVEKTNEEIMFTSVLNPPQSNVKVFRYTNPDYNNIMVSALSGMLGEI